MVRCEITSQVLRSLACHLIVEHAMCLGIVPTRAHRMGKVANADLRRRNVLVEVAHVRARCRALRQPGLTSLHLTLSLDKPGAELK